MQRNITKMAIIGLVCGLFLSAVILGLGGRLLMRIIALISQKEPGFSIGGTFEIIGFATLIGMPSGLLFVLLKRFIPGNSVLKGVIFGAVVFVFLLLIPLESKNAAMAFPNLLQEILGMFAILFIAYGICLAVTLERILGRMESV